jgi:hypothetical protein|nr:MAG TPA: hypothetical protein [Caudoviricetes sp.]
MRNMNKMCFIGAASIAVSTEYNKNPDAEFVAIEHKHMDAIVEYFKDHAFYKYNTDLTMDGQLKYKGKLVIAYIGQPIESNKNDIGSMTAEEMKRMLNKVYERSWNAYSGGYSV